MSEVRLQNVSKVYPNEVIALRDVGFSVLDRECLVIVGPSGSGKTTALRIIAGLEIPTRGEVVIGGEVMTMTPAADRNVAMVFQDDTLYPHRSVQENLSFGLRMRRIPSAERRRLIAEVVERLGLEPLLTRLPHQLSGGQRQRVALGRAIVRHPNVCLFDEPFSHLDPSLREQARSELIDLRQRSEATMIYVTHDHREAMRMGDRLVVMRAGVIQQIDTPEIIYQKPINRFVAEFIGDPPMNFLAGELAKQHFQSQDATLPIRGLSHQGSVVLGVRPEDLTIVRDPSQGVPGQIKRIEFLGRDRLVYVDVLGQSWVILDGATDCEVGEQVRLAFPTEAIHLFDGDSEQSRLENVNQ
ncbi:MAG: ABC transporter ATP-binding protein [Pirellulaceae bacterium]|nr:ABC transporter ATP-binding protein [Pirellulaceae bacterium]